MTLIPILAIFASGWTVLLLLARLIEQIIWAAYPETIHSARTSDRALGLICGIAMALIAMSLWGI